MTLMISRARQVGNAACVLGTVSDRDAFEELYYMYWLLGLPTRRSARAVIFFVLALSVHWDSGWHG